MKGFGGEGHFLVDKPIKNAGIESVAIRGINIMSALWFLK